jgi:tripartite motif-containing protein 71
MNRLLFMGKIFVILCMSQMVACVSLNFPAAVPIEVSISTAKPVVIDSAPARLPLELVWESGVDLNALDVPVGVAVDTEGNVYVMDTNNSRVQKFDNKGHSLLIWGSEGSGEGQFGDILNPHEGRLAVDSHGNVYVIDLKNVRIQKFDNDGQYLTQWGSKGSGEGQLIEPFDIAIDPQDHVYVTDMGSNTVQKFDETGRFLQRWGTYGYQDGEFSDVYSVAIAPDGNVLVTDSTGRIQKFSSTGQFISTTLPEPVDNQGVFLWNIAVDNHGDIYVADWYGNRIVKLDPEGKALAAWTGADVGIDWFANLREIAVDQRGNIYVTDGTQDLIRKFRQPAFQL